jgi:Rod binding domain-containing protein
MPLPLSELQIRPAPPKPGPKGDHDAQLQQVAKQFESILVSQLLSVMWKTTPSMGSGQAGMYQQMFQQQFAEHW